MDHKRASDDDDSPIAEGSPINEIQQRGKTSARQTPQELDPVSDEGIWLNKQRDIPAPLRGPALENVLARLEHKNSRDECRRLFGQCGNDELKFLHRLEQKVSGYGRKYGVAVSLDRVLYEEHKIQQIKQADLRCDSKEVLARIEYGLAFNEETQRNVERFSIHNPQVKGAERWLTEIKNQNRALKKTISPDEISNMDDLIDTMEDLRVEVDCAGFWGNSLEEVRRQVTIGKESTEFDYVVRWPGKDKEFTIYGDAKNGDPYSIKSLNFPRAVKQIRLQLSVIEKLGGGKLAHIFAGGVGDDCAQRYTDMGVWVFGIRMPMSGQKDIRTGALS